jgi:glycosyltransferase involved in cell wall biosynthesis
MKLSVCTLVLNEENKLNKCLSSVKTIADEMIVLIDDNTNDKSEKIAKEYTENVFRVRHNDNFHINKNKAIARAKGDWILWMDGDEYVSKELAGEIKKGLRELNKDGYWIPRKNIIWGKWIKHSGWYPDHQMRLFKKDKAKFDCISIHEHPKVKGEMGYLNNSIVHHNYESLDQFLSKLIKYTSIDADKLDKEIKTLKVKYFLKKPIDEFIKRFLAEKGYKDGLHGLTLSLMQSFYQFVTVVKVWERRKFDNKKVDLGDIKVAKKDFERQWRWWMGENRIRESNNAVMKIWLKIKRKLGR